MLQLRSVRLRLPDLSGQALAEKTHVAFPLRFLAFPGVPGFSLRIVLAESKAVGARLRCEGAVLKLVPAATSIESSRPWRQAEG